jgi:hypothetical protein
MTPQSLPQPESLPDALVKLRYRRLAVKGKEHWQPLDSEWQTAAENWLVAHDLYHHRPGDKGTFFEELVTLGAEYYVNYEGTDDATDDYRPGQRALERAGASIVAMALEAFGATFLVLEPTTGPPAVDVVATHVFDATAQAVTREMAYSCAGLDDSDYHEALARLSSAEELTAALRKGYFLAKERFPDQAAARAGFKNLLAALHQLDRDSAVKPGDILELSLEGHDTHIQVVPAEA